MNAPVANALTEVQKIERALDALLTAATGAKPLPGEERGPVSMALLVDEMLSATPAQRDAEGLLRNPLGEAARRGVSSLGKRLFELGGMDLMLTTLDRVAGLDPPNWSLRTDICDKRWDGIGRSATSSGWCC